MAIHSIQMPGTQGGGYRYSSDLVPGQYFLTREAAETAEQTAQQAKDREIAQQQANTSVTQNQATHIPTADALSQSRLTEEGRQFDASNTLANAKLAQSDPAYLASLQADAEARRLSQFSTMFSGGAGGTGGIDPVMYGGADAEGARNAVYARAKDQIANQQRASLTALQNVAAQRGTNVAGGTNPALQAQEGQIINNAQGQLGDVTREQAIQDLKGQQHAADQTYTGQIQQRGQNLSNMQSLMGLVTSRGLYLMADRPKTADEAFAGFMSSGGVSKDKYHQSIGQYWDPMDLAMRGLSSETPEQAQQLIQQRYDFANKKNAPPVASAPVAAAPVMSGGGGGGGGDVSDVAVPAAPSLGGLQAAASGDGGDMTKELTPPSLRDGIGTRTLPQESMALAGLRKAY